MKAVSGKERLGEVTPQDSSCPSQKCYSSWEKGGLGSVIWDHKHVVTIRRKPGGLMCWWRSLVNTGMNSQNGILMFYLYMQIRIDMKMGRKKSQKYNQCLSHYPFGSVLLQSSLFARSVLFWLSSNLLFSSLASKQADVILFRQQTQR